MKLIERHSLFHEKYKKLLEYWFFKDLQGVEILGPTHF